MGPGSRSGPRTLGGDVGGVGHLHAGECVARRLGGVVRCQDTLHTVPRPEKLKHGSHGYWSRRSTDEHRLVYKVIDGEIRIAACRYHYAT
ncbi:MAG: Txe/YoeB family addiction module toxin [Mycobacteriales bacterium]